MCLVCGLRVVSGPALRLRLPNAPSCRRPPPSPSAQRSTFRDGLAAHSLNVARGEFDRDAVRVLSSSKLDRPVRQSAACLFRGHSFAPSIHEGILPPARPARAAPPFFRRTLAKLSSHLPLYHHRPSCPSSRCRRHLGSCRNPAPRTATSRLFRQGPDLENLDGSCVLQERDCFRLQVPLYPPPGIALSR